MRIAIVNDVAMSAEVLRRAVDAMPGYSVAWIARNGQEAVESCCADLPDLILMDLLMPVMDGVEATRRIMSRTPCPILIVTATVDSNAGKVFEALSAGAVDAVQTPSLDVSGKFEGLGALKFKIDTLRHFATAPAEPRASHERLQPAERLVAIGASAGGPAAIATILRNLPPDFPAGIIIVQHLDAQFVPVMAEWITERTSLAVRVAKPGDRPRPGTALIASSEDHLTFVTAHTLGYTAEPRGLTFRPSVDVLFHSVVRHWQGRIAAVLLTGMGRDGATGLKALRDSGALTIAQDAETSVVYGMPKAAAELKAAKLILPVEQIAGELCNFFHSATAAT